MNNRYSFNAASLVQPASDYFSHEVMHLHETLARHKENVNQAVAFYLATCGPIERPNQSQSFRELTHDLRFARQQSSVCALRLMGKDFIPSHEALD